MSLIIAHKSNDPTQSVVIFSLLQSGGFSPRFQNYYHGFIALGYLPALGGLNILLPEHEITPARQFLETTKAIEDFDPIPNNFKKEIIQASVVNTNPFFFVFLLPPTVQLLLFFLVVFLEVQFLSINPASAIILNSGYAFLVVMISHAKYIAAPKLREAQS